MTLFESERAVIERGTYRHAGRELVAWTIRPRLGGPFPMLVVNHGSGLTVGAGGRLEGTPEKPSVDPALPAWHALADAGWLFLFPEGRGYGGSEGPDPRRAAMTDVMGMLQGRAEDAVAAIDWAVARPDVDAGRIGITGGSHGGVVTLLVAGQRAFAAAVPQAVGASYGHTEMGAVTLANAAARIRCPVLFQHMRSDTLVPMEGARHIFDWSSRFRAEQRWRDYAGVAGVEGHFMFDPRNRAMWFPEYRDQLRAAFAGGVAMPAPEDPAELLSDDALPFALPELRGDAPRWVGRFGTGPGSVETMLVLDGETAVYAWKQSGSRGYAKAAVTHRGDALMIEPWAGTTVFYTPQPDGAWDAVFNRMGSESRARLVGMVASTPGR